MLQIASHAETAHPAPIHDATSAGTVPAVLLVSPGLDAASRAAARAEPPPVVVEGDAEHCALLRSELNSAVRVLHADPTALPFAEGVFSVVVVGAAARLTLTAIGELARVLAPGGRLAALGHALRVERHGIQCSDARRVLLDRSCAPRRTR